MATYVISDIHGELEQLKILLEKIKFSEKDFLYVLGDVVDRGPHPVKTLQFLMGLSNVICIAGNHEVMCLESLGLLMNEITEEFLDHVSTEDFARLADWMRNGAEPTILEFSALDIQEKQDIIEYLKEFSVSEELSAGGTDYWLVHAGIDNFSEDKPLEKYSVEDLIWKRADYEIPYFSDVTVVSGHTPTKHILGNPRPGYIYRANNHIAIDCGACFEGGRLAAICLETGEEFYSR